MAHSEAAWEEVGLILHLGAGACARLEAYLQSPARSIVLVEANPALARALEARAGLDGRVQVWDLAVAATEGPAELQVFNLEPLSSLRAPEELTALFPGLHRVATIPVTAVTPDALVAILPWDDPGAGAPPDVLIIDTPGEEEAVIDGLAAAGALLRFRRILLHAGTGRHYAGSVPADRLRQRLEAAGYRLERTDTADPDRPCLEFFLPQAAVEAAARISALRDECAALRAARDAALDTLQASTEAAVQEAERAFAARQATLEAELAEARASAQAAQAASAAAEREAARAAAQLSQHSGRIAEMESALAEARTTAQADAECIAALRAEGDALRRAAREARAEAERARAETAGTLEGLRDDLALALRQQALRDADLGDLRRRHAEVVAQKDRQDALLQDLTQRLTAAAEVLQTLDALDPEGMAAMAAASDASAPGLAPAGRGGRKKKKKKKSP